MAQPNPNLQYQPEREDRWVNFLKLKKGAPRKFTISEQLLHEILKFHPEAVIFMEYLIKFQDDNAKFKPAIDIFRYAYRRYGIDEEMARTFVENAKQPDWPEMRIKIEASIKEKAESIRESHVRDEQERREGEQDRGKQGCGVE